MSDVISNKVLVLAVAAVLFGAGLGAGLSFGPQEGATTAAASGEKKVLFYRNPMNPAITSPTAAKDEMGMDYIPVYEGEEEGGEEGLPVVRLAPETANSLGVRTEAVMRGELARRIESVGYVGFDEEGLSHVHLRAEGWIEGLAVRAVGEPVRKGELLFRFYSPELVNAQEEFLQAQATGERRLIAASRERLLALGIDEATVRGLEQRRQPVQRLPVYAHQDGIVAALAVREGMFVRPAMDVMTLADLGRVWVLVEVFERQTAWVQAGQKAEVQLPSLPGRRWAGTVDYVYPTLDPKTRTLKVRLRFDNADGALKPNMYARATVYAEPRLALSVPREALIRTGSGDRLVLAREAGRFQPVEVVAGIESGERVEIREGVAEGDRVVVSSQFLLDSESSLKAAMRRMSTPEEPSEPLKIVHTAGTLEAIDTGARKVSMTHEPIPELGWPAMTMDFEVADGVVLKEFAPGSRVRFELHQLDQYRYRIAAMAVSTEAAPVAAAPAAGGALFPGRGVVNSVDAAAGRINISHEPMAELGWPPMTMDFTAAAGVDLSGVQPGSEVEFTLRQLDAVTYELAEIRPAGHGGH